MLNFNVLLQACLFVCGLIWCKQILCRLPQDLDEFQAPTTDGTARGVIGFFWASVALVGYWEICFIAGLF